MVAHELQNTCVFCKKTKDKVKKLFFGNTNEKFVKHHLLRNNIDDNYQLNIL